MPAQILPAKALDAIESIAYALMQAFEQLDSQTQARISELYELMRVEVDAAEYDWQKGAAVARFLAALETIPAVYAVVGPQIEATKGQVRRGDTSPVDADLLQRLPGRIAPLYAFAGPPSEDEGFAGPPADDEGIALPAAAPIAPAAPTRNVPPPAPAPEPAVERPPLTRYADLDYPNQVVIGARTSLTVCLLLNPSDPQAAPSFSTRLVLADGAETPPQLEIVVSGRGFEILDSNTQLLDVDREAECEVRFVLIPRQPGAQAIKVKFYQNNRVIGAAERTVQVVTQPSAAVTVVPGTTLDAPTAVSLEFAPEASAPDLELCVETDPRDPHMLSFMLHSSTEDIDYHHARMGEMRLQGSPLAKMQDVYNELNKLAGQAPSNPDDVAYQRRRLARLGNRLWEELFSPELKTAYWNFKDRVTTLLITSDEPWIPWEIVKPFTYDANNARVDEPHLCETFVMARWLSGPGLADKMLLQRVRPVAPESVNLQSVQAELALLETLNQFRTGLQPDTPYHDRNRVIDLFETGSVGILHFAAHGAFDSQSPDNSGIALTGGVLRPSDLLARFGGPRPRPLIFINACHGARTEFVFTGLGGWADRLVRQARVGAFVGAAWEVNDRLALMFAEAFYAALLRDGKSIGESFQCARRHIRDAEPSNSTWLAYVLYADPEARVFVKT